MKRLTILCFCALIATLLLAACSGPGAATPTIQPTTVPAFATATAIPSAPSATTVPTALTTDAPTSQASAPGPAAGNIAACGILPIPPATVSSTPRMSPAQMATASIGWATTVGRVNDFAIVRTADGGATWQAVSPAGIWDHLATTFAFLGERNAWVILTLDDLAPPASVRVVTLLTRDGGQTWQCGEPFVPGSMARQLTFVDAQHGTLLVGAGAGDAFAATDGGLHWARPRA